MDRAAWNELADDFEELVCDVSSEETNDQLRRFVSAARPSPKTSVLVDLGCGIGSFILRFGHRFKEIIAVEHAPRTIARAKERCAAITNIEWLTMDVARAVRHLGPCADLTVCLQVITSVSAATRNAQWAGIATITKPGGFALIVVPSLESEEMVQGHIDRGASGVKSKITATIIERQGFRIRRLAKISSPWAREGMAKPASSGADSPWDWICLAERTA
jgi:SAM-dependent methyltransferase